MFIKKQVKMYKLYLSQYLNILTFLTFIRSCILQFIINYLNKYLYIILLYKLNLFQ